MPLWDAGAGLPKPAAGDVRCLLIGDRRVHYVLRRSRRRTIGLTISAQGLRVGAPPRASLREIEALIVKHGDWVLAKLEAWAVREARPTIAIADGAVIPVLGRQVVLRLTTGNNRAAWQGDELMLALRQDADPAALLERALREHALDRFAERLQHYAARLGVQPPRLGLSNARLRWGSCSRLSGIRLNWRLVLCAPHLLDYVVAHEVAHLREMNHSPRFWAVVASLYPAWQAARRELRHAGEHLPTFSGTF